MKRLGLLKAVPLAGVLVVMLPVAAKATPYPPFCSGDTQMCESGGVIWYNRSVGIQGTGTYTGTKSCGGYLDFSFFLDEAETSAWAHQTRTLCTPHRDFNFTQPGPQGGIRAVQICARDLGASYDDSVCINMYRSQANATDQDLPTLPDFDTGA